MTKCSELPDIYDLLYRLGVDAEKLRTFVQGTELETVLLGAVDTPTIRKLVYDFLYSADGHLALTQEAVDEAQAILEQILGLVDPSILDSYAYNVRRSMVLAEPLAYGDVLTLPANYYPGRSILFLSVDGMVCTPKKDDNPDPGERQYEEVGTDPNVLSSTVKMYFPLEAGATVDVWVVASNLMREMGRLEAAADRAEDAATAAEGSANAAGTKAGEAATSATTATSKATAASNSATQAAASKDAAATSATAAAGSATNAASSASTASTKAGEASTSATAAGNSATQAATSATTASSKATAAGNSATAAAGSATAAAGSATNAASSASTASTKAGEAASSATTAAGSKNAAATSATAAAGSASSAATSASSAEDAATAAAGSASDAGAEADRAASSATAAANSATQAAASKNTAATSATNAASSASTASARATAAGSSATAAAGSATAAAASADRAEAAGQQNAADIAQLQSDVVAAAKSAQWASVSGKPSTYIPTAHKTTHATDGTDAIAPADIGAQADMGITGLGGTPAALAFGGAADAGSSTAVAREDHAHAMPAAPTTITGNAGTATKLQNARTIDGIGFDGSENIVIPRYGVMTSVAATGAKAVTCSGFVRFTGAIVAVFMSGMNLWNTNTPTDFTINVNDTGAAPVRYRNASPTSNLAPSNTVMLIQFDGSNWNILNPTDIIGNAATATKFATARVITLVGAVTGSGNFNGAADLTITTTAKEGSALVSAAGSRTAAIAANTNYTVPSYTVGANQLHVFLEGCRCDIGLHFTEVGTAGAASTIIRFTSAIPTDYTIGVYVTP